MQKVGKMTEIFMSSNEENKDRQSSIVVPIDDDMDTVKSDSPDTVDELAMELAISKTYCYYR